MTSAGSATAPVHAGGAEEAGVRLTVAVPTFRRVDRLRTMLPLVLAQARELADSTGGRYVTDVLVVDNDPERSAAPVAAGLADPRLRYVSEPTPGIAAVRNRALAESAEARLLAFIDDDERPGPQWLAALVRTWARTGAAGVAGRVETEYDGELDPWIAAGRFFARPSLPTGTRLPVAATSNLLLDLDRVRTAGIRFDPSLGMAGGEDNLFTATLTRRGETVVWCAESVVADPLPPERLTRSWVLMRSWSHGNAAALTALRVTRGGGARLRVRTQWATRGLLRVSVGLLRWCLGVVSCSVTDRARGLRMLYRGAGMVGGSCGVVYREYARDGRRWHLSRVGGR